MGLNIFSHSQGTVIVANVLKNLIENKRKENDLDNIMNRISSIVLAHSNIEARIYQRDTARILQNLNNTISAIYTSIHDSELKASNFANGHPRLGLFDKKNCAAAPLELINIISDSGLNNAHSWVFNQKKVLKDIGLILNSKRGAQERTELKKNGLCWQLHLGK